MSICIFGGTFDPPHLAHLILAESVLNNFSEVDKIKFVPAWKPPHKNDIKYQSYIDRMKMVKLATKDRNKFEVSDIEKNLKGESYSIRTIEKIKKKNSLTKKDIFFLIGMDSLEEFDTWKQPKNIMNSYNVIVAKRPGFNTDKVKEKYIKQSTIFDSPTIGISSTMIRNYLKNGKSIKYLVNEKVEKYIIDNELYK